MTALNKQALRSREEFEEYYNETHAVKVTSQFKRFGYYVSPTMQKAWELWQNAQSSMLNELKSAENNLIDSECHVAELEESLRDKQALLEVLDNSICELLPGTQYMDHPDGGSVTPLEQVRRMVADYRERIAELESRTVTLPEALNSYAGVKIYRPNDVIEAIRAAGIGVKGE
ncbi:TPA: hypothetical protein ACW5N9_004474 [Salmonella enterica subsp. enterica serovar Saintpaul]